MTTEMLSTVASDVVSMAILLLLLYLVSRNAIMSRGQIKKYRVAILLTVTVIIAEIVTTISDARGVNWMIPNLLGNLVGFSLSVFIAPCISEIYWRGMHKRIKWLLLPMYGNVLLVCLSPLTGWIFHLSADNVYTRGPLFAVYIAVYLYSFGLLLFANIRQTAYYGVQEQKYLWVLFGVLMVGTTVQVALPDVHISWQCITLSLVMYYAFWREVSFRHDTLTGMLNRAAFERDTRQLEHETQIAVIMFDLNRFKDINDRYGHSIGDYFLQQSGEVLLRSFGKIGSCYRLGGDEFCALAVGANEIMVLESVRQMKVLLERNRARDERCPDIAYGYSFYQASGGLSLTETLKQADQQMYAYKKASKEHLTK